MPRGGKSKSGGGTVRVSGYTRADGTYVAGYTRSLPGSGKTSGGPSRSSGASGTVHVKGYTRSDGTYVSGYTRSAPRTKSYYPSSSSESSSDNLSEEDDEVSVGYTRLSSKANSGYTQSSDDFYYDASAGYTHSSPRKKSYSSSSALNDMVYMSGYLQPNASGYTRGSNNYPRFEASVGNVDCTRFDDADISTYMRSSSGTSNRSYLSSCTSSHQPVHADPSRSSYQYAVDQLQREIVELRQTIEQREKVKQREKVEQREMIKQREKVEQREMQREKVEQRETVKQREKVEQRETVKQREKVEQREEVEQRQTVEQRQIVEENWKKKDLNPSTSNVASAGHMVDLKQQELLGKEDQKEISSRANVTSVGKVKIPLKELKVDKHKIIGTGSFGEVYAAKLDASGYEKPVAYKKLLRQRMSKRQSDNFLNEVCILAGISHPHVITTFGAVVEENNIGIIMERLKCSLYQAIFTKDVQFSDSKKKNIIYQVADALKYLHAYNPRAIAHRDVKSENILLDWQDNAKLCDFGLGDIKNNTNSTRSSRACGNAKEGTPCYSTPEVLRGEILNNDQLLQTDVYSLAVVVFEVLTEEEPFYGLTERQLQVNVGDGTMLPTTHASNVVLPPPVEDLLNMCWERDGKRRPSADEFHAKWSSLVYLTRD